MLIIIIQSSDYYSIITIQTLQKWSTEEKIYTYKYSDNEEKIMVMNILLMKKKIMNFG